MSDLKRGRLNTEAVVCSIVLPDGMSHERISF